MAKSMGMGWFKESHRHALAARGIRTVIKKGDIANLGLGRYRYTFPDKGTLTVVANNEREALREMNKKSFLKDSDHDGVPDKFDCSPHDPTRQDSPQQSKRADVLWKYLDPPLLPGEEIEADELYLFTVNDGEIYQSRRKPVEEMLLKKMRKGDYKSRLALLSFKAVADDGAGKYYQDFGGKNYFTPKVRAWAAKKMLDDFEAEPDITGG